MEVIGIMVKIVVGLVVLWKTITPIYYLQIFQWGFKLDPETHLWDFTV